MHNGIQIIIFALEKILQQITVYERQQFSYVSRSQKCIELIYYLCDLTLFFRLFNFSSIIPAIPHNITAKNVC